MEPPNIAHHHGVLQFLIACWLKPDLNAVSMRPSCLRKTTRFNSILMRVVYYTTAWGTCTSTWAASTALTADQVVNFVSHPIASSRCPIIHFNIYLDTRTQALEAHDDTAYAFFGARSLSRGAIRAPHMPSICILFQSFHWEITGLQAFPHPLARIKNVRDSRPSSIAMRNYLSYLVVNEYTYTGLFSIFSTFRTEKLGLEPIRFGSSGATLLDAHDVSLPTNTPCSSSILRVF